MPDLPPQQPPPQANNPPAAPPPAPGQQQPPPLAANNAFADLVPKQQGGAAPSGPTTPPPISPDNPFADLITGVSAPKPRSLSAALSDQIGDAASLGVMPKVSGAISGLDAIVHGQPYMPAYEAERNRLNDQFAAYRAQHPIASTLGQIGGSILNPANEIFNKAGEGVAKWGAEKLGDFGKSMLFRALANAGVPAGLAGGARAVGTTVGDTGDYAKNALLNSLFSTAAGTALGTAGQVAGKYLAARSGARLEPELYAQAKSADLYDDDVPGGYIDKFIRAVNGSKPERPIIAQAYQLAQEKAASMGNPLPDLPISTPEARAAEALRGRTNPDQPTLPAGLSLRVIDETKKALNAMVRAPGGAALKDVERSFYSDFVQPAEAAVPEYAQALGAHKDVAQMSEFAGRISPLSKESLPATIAGGVAGLAAGHPAGGASAARVLSALAQTPAARDATAGLAPPIAQGLSPAVGQLVSMIMRQRAAQPAY